MNRTDLQALADVRIAEAALTDSLLVDAFLRCWKFGESEMPENAGKFDSLQERLQCGEAPSTLPSAP